MTEAQDKNSLIAERLRFFFSDANLRHDKFLRNIVMDSESEGFVPIDTLLKFNTIKKLSTDPCVIAAVVENTDNLSLKLNDAKTAIARIQEFTEEMLHDDVKFSLRISNLPVNDDNQFKNTREEISDLFKDYGKVAMVRLLTHKKHDKRVAYGKCFVIFADESSLKKAEADLCIPVDSDENAKPNKILRIGDTDLRIKTMQSWLSKKASQKGDRITERNDAKRAQKEKVSKEQEELEQIEFKLDWKKGCVISIKGLPDGSDREAILAAVQSFMGADINARADYSRGDTEGAIRFDEPNDRINELASKLNDGSITIGGGKIESAAVLQGEAEEKYYAEYIASRTKLKRARAEQKLHIKKRRHF